MACVLCQYDPPDDDGLVAEYESWLRQGGLDEALSLDGVEGFRAYRNYGMTWPVVTAMIFFSDLKSALQAADTAAWRCIVANLTRMGCRDITLTVLVPSPIVSRVPNKQIQP